MLGQRLHEARNAIEGLIEKRRVEISFEELSREMADSRIDLTEFIPGSVAAPALPGHLHLVSLTRDELEDVFVGMGFEVAEGPEIETDWFNFGALNIPPAHPAAGDVGHLLPRPRCSGDHAAAYPHLARPDPPDGGGRHRRGLPIHAVMPGRCYRRDTPDARHLPVFHQIEGLVVDKGDHLRRPGRDHRGVHHRLFRSRHPLAPPARLLPVHRAVGGVRGDLHHLPRRGLPDVLARPDGSSSAAAG